MLLTHDARINGQSALKVEVNSVYSPVPAKIELWVTQFASLQSMNCNRPHLSHRCPLSCVTERVLCSISYSFICEMQRRQHFCLAALGWLHGASLVTYGKG